MKKIILILLFLSFAAQSQDTKQIQQMLDLDRFHAYTQSWALQKQKHIPEAANAILKLKPTEIPALGFSPDKFSDAFNYDEIILSILNKKHPSINISGEDVKWGYDFYKRKLNNSYVIGKPSNVSEPAKVPVIEPGNSGGVSVTVEAAEAEEVLLNVDSYVANRTTRGVFWEASQSGRKIELHVGGPSDFKLNLAQRGAKIIGEVKTEANNYNPIYIIQDPGETSFHYAVTEISGNDRLKHFQMQTSLVRWEAGKGKLAPPPPIEIVGDAAAKLAREEAELTQVLKVIPKADHVLLGQKGAFERTIGSLGKIHAMIEMAEKHPSSLTFLSADHQKLIQKALKNKTDLNAFVMKNASPIDKVYEKSKELFAKFGITEAPVHAVYNLDKGSYAVSDYILLGSDGKPQRWRVFSNVWGDEVIPVVKALKNTAHNDIVYMGTAGALANSGLKVGDLAIPQNSHDINGVVRKVQGRIVPEGAKSVSTVTHVSSPFEETNAWLADRSKFAQLVEVETGYIAQVYNGKKDKVSMMLLVSDVVGSEGETLAEASSSARRNAQIKAISTVLSEAGVSKPASAQLGDDVYKWINEIAPTRDPVSKFQIYKEAEIRKITSKEGLATFMQAEKGFTTQRLLTSINEADLRMLKVIELIKDKGLAPDISFPRTFLEGRWNPANGPITVHLRSANPDSIKELQKIISNFEGADKNFAKFLKVSVTDIPADSNWIKLPGFLDNPEGTIFNLYKDSAIGFGGLAATETRTGNVKFVQVSPPQKGKAAQNLAYFKPNEETEVLLKQFSKGSYDLERSIKLKIEDINKGAFNGHYEVRLNKVPELPEGALASITPELADTKLIINLNMTPQGLENKAVALEEFVHLLQITAQSDDKASWMISKFASYPHPYAWAEAVANAKAGSVTAMEQLAKLELEAAKITDDVFKQYPGIFKLKEKELQDYLQKRQAHAEEEYKKIAKVAKADMKRRQASWERMKEVFNKLEKDSLKFNELVAKNDRKGVRAMLEKYIPWDVMEPSEINSWKEWLEAMENPDPAQAEVVFRGIDGDLLVKSADESKPGLLSTVLTKNQGNYTRRLRSIATSREKIGIYVGYDAEGMPRKPVNSSLLQTMNAHATDPVGSPFLSVSNHDVAKAFGMQKRIALKIDKRRLVPNAMAFGFLSERERLVPLVIFPDEVIHIDQLSKEEMNNTETWITLDDHKFVADVEAKLGRPLKDFEYTTVDEHEDFIRQGYDRIKALMLDPMKLPKVQVCSLEDKSCECVFKTLNALLK